VVVFAANLVAADALYRFDVPAGPAADTLKMAAQQAGLEIAFFVDTVRDTRTPELHGHFTAREALDRLVAGTNLTIVSDRREHTCTVRRGGRSSPTRSVAPTSSSTDPPPTVKSRSPLMTILSAWLALAFGAAQPAYSAGAPDAATLARYDRNHNGTLDADELSQMDRDQAKEHDAIKLTPFEVSTSKDRGYAAGNTLSGGRVDTPLELTPGSISVMTREFMDDFNVTNVNQAGTWTIGFDLGTPVGSSNPSSISTYQVMFRGAQPDQNYPMRNGVINFGVADSYNTERFEFQRGPDTSMFGDGGPGGRQSSTSKRPTFNRSATSVSAQGDSYGGYRSTLDYSKGWERFGLRLNTLYQNNRFYTDETNRIKKAWTLNTVTKLDNNTQLIAEYERVNEWNQLWSATIGDSHILWDGTTVNNDNTPIAGNNATDLANLGIQLTAANNSTDYFTWDFGTGTFENFRGNQYRTRPVAGVYRIPWPGNPNLPPTRTPALKGINKHFNLHAKSNVAARDADTLFAAIEHRAGNLFLKLSFDQNHYDNITPYSNTSPNDYIIDLNRLMPDGLRPNPMFLRPFVDVVQNRIYNEDRVREVLGLATYLFSRPQRWDYHQQLSLSTGYRELHNESFTDAWRRVADSTGAAVDPFAANAANQVRYRVYWYAPRPDIATIFTNPNKYFGSAGKWAIVQEAGNLTDRTVKYAGLTSQSAFFNQRLALTASFRRDIVGVDTMNRLSGAAGYDPVTFKNVLGTTGVPGAHFKREEKVNAIAYGAVTFPFRGGNDAAGGWLKKAIAPIGFVYNYAENTQPPGGGEVNPLIDGTPAPLTHSRTKDFGLRYSIPGGRAYLTVTHYNTDQKDLTDSASGAAFGSAADIRAIWTNLGYTDPLLVGSTAFSYTDPKDRKLEGWEMELTANPTRNLTLTANYAHPLTYIEKDSEARKAYVAAHRAEWQAGAKAQAGQVINGRAIIDPVAIQTALTNIDNSLAGLTPGTLEDGTISANYRHRPDQVQHDDPDCPADGRGRLRLSVGAADAPPDGRHQLHPPLRPVSSAVSAQHRQPDEQRSPHLGPQRGERWLYDGRGQRVFERESAHADPE
jgi:outer membrane receptor protein involved in Fe transport